MHEQGEFTRVFLKTSQFAAIIVPALGEHYQSASSLAVATSTTSPPMDAKSSTVSLSVSPSRSGASLLALPTHATVLTRLVEKFNIGATPIYSGIAVEQSMVNLAGVTTAQTGAKFQRAPDGSTSFKLRLENEANVTQFRNYYGQQYPGFIKAVTLNAPFAHVTVDTAMLYNTVAVRLGAHHQATNHVLTIPAVGVASSAN